MLFRTLPEDAVSVAFKHPSSMSAPALTRPRKLRHLPSWTPKLKDRYLALALAMTGRSREPVPDHATHALPVTDLAPVSVHMTPTRPACRHVHPFVDVTEVHDLPQCFCAREL